MTIEEIYNIFLKNPLICTDSRNVISGSIFFALKGDNFDGNNFVQKALNNGAFYAITDNPEHRYNNKCIVVDNVLKVLQKLSNYHRQKLDIPVIAITGTNGKTTTKELLASVFAKKYNIVATKGNLNNHIGVPITLLSMNNATEIGILEMGANHIGEIDTLCNIAKPNYGIITNIGKAHIEGFGSFEGIINAKTEIYKYIEKYNGTIFYNYDNKILKKNVKTLKCKTISYGKNKDVFCNGNILSEYPYLSFAINILNKSGVIEKNIIKTNLFGSYNFENALAAACVGIYFDISIHDINKAITEYYPSNNRSQLVDIGNNKLLLDLYNANPSSMEAALNNFYKSKEDNLRKVLILGEMLELGDESENEHLNIIELIKYLGFNEVYLVGKGFKTVGLKTYQYFDNSDLLKDFLNKHKIKNAFIMIKGSRGVKMEKILECFN